MNRMDARNSRPSRVRAVVSAAVLAALLVAAVSSCAAAEPASQPLGLVGEHGAAAKRTATPTPTPTPTVVVTQVEVSVSIPFGETTVDDPSLQLGSTAVSVAGQAGTKVQTFTVTTTNGVETSRVLASEIVTVAPVDQITAVGSFVPQPDPVVEPDPPAAEEPPAADPGGDCDPNYSGPCMPIASDVDCAGGSGNGPAYIVGPVYITGADIYDLDRDGDGVACEPWK